MSCEETAVLCLDGRTKTAAAVGVERRFRAEHDSVATEVEIEGIGICSSPIVAEEDLSKTEAAE